MTRPPAAARLLLAVTWPSRSFLLTFAICTGDEACVLWHKHEVCPSARGCPKPAAAAPGAGEGGAGKGTGVPPAFRSHSAELVRGQRG